MHLQKIVNYADYQNRRRLKPEAAICCIFPATLFLVLVLCLPTLNAQPNSDKDIQKQIEANLKNATLIIKYFYSGNNLVYDSEGSLVKGGNPGPWTLNAYFEPEKVSLSKKSITITGKRLFWSYDDSRNEPIIFRDSNNTKIEINRPPEKNDLSEIRALLTRVFLKNDEPLAEYVPHYWKKIIQADFDVKRLQWNFPPAESNSSASHFSNPVATELPNPDYTEEARRVHMEGTMILLIDIDEAGNAKVTDIVKPLGIGLDDNAVKTIEEIWKFSPATRASVPFAMNGVGIEIRFKLL